MTLNTPETQTIDLSAMVQEIYHCFGFELPRNTIWQSFIPATAINVADMSYEEKCKLLDTLKPGAIFIFPGHEMMYLGEDNGSYYVINNVSSIIDPIDFNNGVIRPRSVIINDLSIKRGSGKTWLECLETIVVIEP